ncbi:amino acid permease [Thalassoglobus sp. JC818]|uniref:APC family permease n=1 Tax=Thalassoglobus sp. JC818 TaxID=3232136 RepID=UPI00345A2BF6
MSAPNSDPPLSESNMDRSSIPQTLGVWDVVGLLVGIVVGTAIFKSPPLVFKFSPDAGTAMLLWGLGAASAFCGALCYCELATTYPFLGGEFVYLSRAFGARTGFLFAWMQLTVILTGSIGAMAFVFADYAVGLDGRLAGTEAMLASGALCLLAGIHLRGVHIGKLVQNLLSLTKIVSLGSILVIGLFLTAPANLTETSVSESGSNIGLALVFVLYAYGGWNDAAMVTSEVKDYQRNMPRALLIGLTLIAVLYLGLNVAFVKVLGVEGVRNSAIPATDVVESALGAPGGIVMSCLVMLSALGAVHGMLFSSSRLLSAVGRDYPLFRKWNEWNARRVPVRSIVTTTSITLLLVLAVGTNTGQRITTLCIDSLHLPQPQWDNFDGGFEMLVAATAPVFWIFFALSGLSVIVLRVKDGERERPFRVPLYPLPPLLFVASAIFMLWKSLDYAKELTLLSLPVLIIGVIVSFTRNVSQRTSSTST